MSEGRDVFSDENNPYRASSIEAAAVGHADSHSEAIRHAHIQHEANTKSIGTLFVFGGAGLILVGIGVVAFLIFSGRPGRQELLIVFGIAALFIALGCAQAITAFGLWQLKPWSRWVAVVINVVGLVIGFPVGTLVCGYFLFLLLSGKGTMVFSEPYKEIIAKTPHIKYKTPAAIWISLVAILGLIALGIGTLFFVG